MFTIFCTQVLGLGVNILVNVTAYPAILLCSRSQIVENITDCNWSVILKISIFWFADHTFIKLYWLLQPRLQQNNYLCQTHWHSSFIDEFTSAYSASYTNFLHSCNTIQKSVRSCMRILWLLIRQNLKSDSPVSIASH